MKRIYFYLFFLLSVFFVSCSEEEMKLPEDGGRTEIPDNGQCKMILSDSMVYERVLHQLALIDTLENGEIQRTSLYGKALHETRPTEYYLVADSIEEAFAYFKSVLLPFFLEDSLRQTVSGEWQLNTIGGSLTFHSEPTTDGLATVEVCLNDLPEITRFIFITQNEWPTNGDADGSPFKRGQIIRCRNNNYVYLCIRSCNETEGILITFDGGWDYDYFGRAEKSKYYNYSGFSLKNHCASAEAFTVLTQLVENYPKKMDDILNKLVTHGYANNPTYIALRDILREGFKSAYWVGTHDNDWDWHYGEWWSKKYVYYVVTRYYYHYDRYNQKRVLSSKTYGQNNFWTFCVGHPEYDDPYLQGSSEFRFNILRGYVKNKNYIEFTLNGTRYQFDVLSMSNI